MMVAIKHDHPTMSHHESLAVLEFHKKSLPKLVKRGIFCDTTLSEAGFKALLGSSKGLQRSSL